MTVDAELDNRRLSEFERMLFAGTGGRANSEALWRALAEVFPHRTHGPAERRLLLQALRTLEARGRLRLPTVKGKRWDRSIDPAVPTSVDLVREEAVESSFVWRTFPWHPSLHWVAQCRSLSAQQIAFLRRVHQGFVDGLFRESAPLKYRSLQLTGHEKLLASLATTSLFAESRLTLDMLACLPDALPIAWEAVGSGGRMVIFENAGPFAVARRVLSEMRERRPYDLCAYGGGRAVVAAIGHLKTIEQVVESICYVGDLDHAGLDIAWSVRRSAAQLGLPPVLPATELHRQMLTAAAAFGHPEGWRALETFSEGDRSRALSFLDSAVRADAEAVLRGERRIPEEILGPDELRIAWRSTNGRQ